MSTPLYLQCTCANPAKTSEKPCGAGFRDLRYLYQDISRADIIVQQYKTNDPEIESWDQYQMNTAEFLSDHRDCVLQVVDARGNVLHKHW